MRLNQFRKSRGFGASGLCGRVAQSHAGTRLAIVRGHVNAAFSTNAWDSRSSGKGATQGHAPRSLPENPPGPSGRTGLCARCRAEEAVKLDIGDALPPRILWPFRVLESPSRSRTAKSYRAPFDLFRTLGFGELGVRGLLFKHLKFQGNGVRAVRAVVQELRPDIAIVLG